MATDQPIRLYTVWKATGSLKRAFQFGSGLKEVLVSAWAELGARLESSDLSLRMPPHKWSLQVEGMSDPCPEPEYRVVGIDFREWAIAQSVAKAITSALGRTLKHGSDEYLCTAIGADPGGGTTGHWCPRSATSSTFGDRDAARRLLGIDSLPATTVSRPKVNVVIIDQGLNRSALEASYPGCWGGGWADGTVRPGEAKPNSHGTIVAKNVLDIAPNAAIFDFPVIPSPRIGDVDVFASEMENAYRQLLQCIDHLRSQEKWSGPWVLVNAWAIYDRSTERPLGHYTENKACFGLRGHTLNEVVAQAAERHDVVFAAGNCGTYCNSRKCGALDRGPGRSIWGANSGPGVITAAAVTNHLTWIGQSSQGPGQPRLSSLKPDLSAPSNFHENSDRHAFNTGTSTACALTAGVVAALRSHCPDLAPQDLKRILVDTARPIRGKGWDRDVGYGLVSADGAYRELRKLSANRS